MADEDEEGVTLEEILVEIVDAQLELVEAISSGKPLTDSEALKLRLNDIRDLLESYTGDDEG
ncbi:hypothetical protein [Sphingosinicella sp. BN140058]|uniref:hypothetical protein n=1 Tax=Sphingosinicella sp. BN140058 TaxID=1892855 RepID=UPI001012AF88|nr:hypothetical protein [Sphingosinicella sp. BN140058]QAY79499.1 hypothetical protein ETR14_25350 [Sphingosinicella sp. BN140058]